MCVSGYMGVEVQKQESDPRLEGLDICAAAAGETGVGEL